MGFFGIYNSKEIASDKNLADSDNNVKRSARDDEGKKFSIEMDKYISVKNIYLIGDENVSDIFETSSIRKRDLILDHYGILKKDIYKKKESNKRLINTNINFGLLLNKSEPVSECYDEIIKFKYGEYIKMLFTDYSQYGMFEEAMSIVRGNDGISEILFGVNTYCKNEIEKFYNEYNRLLHEKIIAFCIETKELQEMAHKAISLCDEYTLMDLDSIKTLYYLHTPFYKLDDFGGLEEMGCLLESNSLNTISGIIQNMAEILLEEIDEPEIALEHAAFEAFMRAYIEHFAEEFDKYIINECEENEVSDEIGDYRKYIKSAVEIIDFTNEDKLIIALTCKLFSLGLLEEHITLVDAYDIVINEIEIAEKNRNNNLIKDMLRGKKPIDRKKYTIDEVDLMDGYMFEDFICKLFEKMGYSAEVTQKTNDQGIDVIGKKNGRKLGIQAKCYSSKVGNSAIQEAVAGKNFYNCDSVMVITNNYFTEAAKALARANEVILWDRSMLSKKIDEFL